MSLPKSNRELDPLFKKGTLPEVKEFNGEQYYVNILTGMPNFRRFNHRKTFYMKQEDYFGNNMILGKLNFGYFSVESGFNEALDLPVANLNYDQPRTSFILKPMRDHIRCLETQKLYLGRYNIINNNGVLTFKGYFSLRR